MMFVLVTIGLYQLYKCRSPDIHPSPHKLLLVLAVLIFFIGMGVVSGSCDNHVIIIYFIYSSIPHMLYSMLCFSSYLKQLYFIQQYKIITDGNLNV